MKKRKTSSRSTPPSDRSRSTRRSDGRDRNYKVGRGRPPVEHRFKPGQCPNPLGRPKGSKGIGTILGGVLKQKVKLTISGRNREVSLREAIVFRFVERALQGDPKAATWVLNNDPAFDSAETSPEAVTSEDDQKILEAYLRKIAEKQAKANKK